MKIFEIDGYWNDDKEMFYGQIVSESDNTPDGYEDDDIFFYGIVPVEGESYDDFTVTAVRGSKDVA